MSDSIIEIQSDVKRIMENHLPHLREQIVEVDKRIVVLQVQMGFIKWVSMSVGVLVIANIVQVLLK